VFIALLLFVHNIKKQFISCASILVYLRTDPEVVHKRILERARKEEKTVPLQYIEALHHIHEEWYVLSVRNIQRILTNIITNFYFCRLHSKNSHPVPAKVIGNL